MLDIKFIRENPDAVRENIKKKFQDAKLPLVDEVLDLDSKRRAAIAEADQLRSNRNTLSKQIGMLMGQAKKDPSKLAEAEEVKKEVTRDAERLAELEKLESSKTAVPTIHTMICAFLGTAFMAGSVFAVTADPPIVWLCALLAVPGFLGWILPYFIYRQGVAKRIEKITPYIEAKYDEIDAICRKGYSLL